MKSQKTQFIFKREKRRSIIWLMLGFFSLFAGLGSVPSHAERIKDLASIQGVRSNPLVGYGLVVGLDGSGDQVRQTPFTQQSLTNMLAQLGVSVPQGTNMQLRNVAAVMVTAQLPAFARPGQTLDVVVSSMGNAKSLRGGTLLMTPLKGADGQVYAMAQGNLLIGGAGAQAGGSSVQINQLNGGIISGGATVEQSVPTTFAQNGRIYLEMHSTDFGVAQQAAAALNRALGEKLGKGGGKQVIATALDGRVVELHAPLDPNALAAFLSKVEQVNVKLPPAAARVIINARTGTVVMNRSVTLEEAAVAAGNLTVVINRQQQVSQPDTPLAGGQTVVTDSAQIDIRSPDGSSNTLKRLRTGANLMDVIRALNTLGASAQDLVTILQTLKSAGALRAELEII